MVVIFSVVRGQKTRGASVGADTTNLYCVYVQKRQNFHSQVYILAFSSQPAADNSQLNIIYQFCYIACFSELDESWIAGSWNTRIYDSIDHLLMLESLLYPFYGYFYLGLNIS